MIRFGFIGAGKMAEGILQAMLRSGVGRGDVVMAETNAERAGWMAKEYGVAVVEDACAVVKAADCIFLAVRPQSVAEVAMAIKPRLSGKKLLVSIVAGKTLRKLRLAFGREVRLVRVMPNLALRVGAGMCAICGAKNATAADMKKVRDCLGAAGEVVVLGEGDFDAVTALSGSGPAFYAYFEKAMVEGGIALGLKPKIARILAEQTMFGTASYLRESKVDLDRFIDGVATRGGTTAAGLSMLTRGGVMKTVAKTLSAAAERSRELA